MSGQWYALRSKANKEETLWRELLARNYEVFYPQIHVQPVNPRSRKVRPYFPGYLFINVDLPAIGYSALSWVPYSYGLVSFDAEPACVPEPLIAAVRRHVDAVNAAGGELYDGLKRGDLVSIADGPFAGYEAIFDARLPGRERVRVLLKLLNKVQMPVELPEGQLKRIKPR
jgi:transcription antitermination factor NusG